MKYPWWVNMSAVLALAVVAMGTGALFLGYPAGMGVCAVGWLGIWVTGALAKKLSEPPTV